MFTQCSKCETVFRLSAEVLRAAGGQVRCGRCGEVFNALARLAEDGKAFTQGESSLDLETRADEILHNAAPVAAPVAPLEAVVSKHSAGGPPPGVEIAQLQIIDPLFEESDPTAESSLEFTLPPGELDRIFVATKKATPLRVLKPPAPATQPARRVPAAKPAADKAVPPAPPALPAAPAAPAAHAPDKPAAIKPIAGLEISDDVRREMLASYEHAELPEINKPRRELPRVVWLLAAFALGALLLLQVLRDKHDWLVEHATFMGGASVNVNPASYELRQWGVTGEPGAKGTLRVRASILNAAAHLQPYPLLRVTLANRFGARVGSRDFEPAEYLGKPTARLLAPNEKVDATLDILDPGKDAEGFEIDVCVRNADKKIDCAGDQANQAK